MRVGILTVLAGLVLLASPAMAQTHAQTPATPSSAPPGLARPRDRWTGDLDGMLKRRTIRVLVPYSKTYYFVDGAVQRGLSYDVTRVLEADLNKKFKTGNMRRSVLCVPVNRGEMIPGLLAGRGDMMMDEYYAREPMDRFNKTLFTFAAYNAGPGRVGQLRNIAARRGLDPNLWFNDVELIAAEKIGRETVTYVSNIYKYYLAYRMIEDERAQREKVKEALKRQTGM
jgi:membrane-bound lytic murein transglycosylase MltF